MATANDALMARFGDELEPYHEILDDPELIRVLGRRTCREYSSVPVPSEMVDALLRVALSASSKSDYQQASVFKVEDPGRRADLAALVPSMPWIGLAPAFLVFCADARRLERISELRGHPQPNTNLESFFNASVDAALAMQTFILAAERVGLGCCPISVIRNHLSRVVEILSLPAGVVPVAGLCIGYPAAAGHVSMRLPLSVTSHTDAYDDSRLPELLEAYDRRRAARHATPREKQRDAKTFGYADFYGWSEDKARQAAGREGSGFGDAVRAQGFTLD
jgi:FMN reductase [NAD(P)H]